MTGRRPVSDRLLTAATRTVATLAVATLAVATLVVGCGVPTQTEPERLDGLGSPPAATPTIAVVPDPSLTTRAVPTSTPPSPSAATTAHLTAEPHLPNS